MTELHQQIVDLLPRLRRFTRALTGSSSDGDDLVQATCERALNKLDSYQTGTRLDSWMYRIAQNLWIDMIRTNKVRGNVVELSAVDERQPESNEQDAMYNVHNTQTQLNQVDTAMQQLSEEQRSILVIICVEGYSYKEAAEILNIPKGTVMSRLARARQQLHKLLASPSKLQTNARKQP